MQFLLSEVAPSCTKRTTAKPEAPVIAGSAIFRTDRTITYRTPKERPQPLGKSNCLYSSSIHLFLHYDIAQITDKVKIQISFLRISSISKLNME